MQKELQTSAILSPVNASTCSHDYTLVELSKFIEMQHTVPIPEV
jgi:hypothetical protein